MWTGLRDSDFIDCQCFEVLMNIPYKKNIVGCVQSLPAVRGISLTSYTPILPLLLFSLFPSSLMLPTQLLSSLPTPWAEPNQWPHWLHRLFSSTEWGTCLRAVTCKHSRAEGEYQTLSVCVHPHHRVPPPSGGPSCSRQKKEIRLPFETTTEGLILQVVPTWALISAGIQTLDQSEFSPSHIEMTKNVNIVSTLQEQSAFQTIPK